jgi:uncharacterized protein (DUF927 family)
MTKTIEARKSLHWKLLFLSTGERTLAEHASTAGKETQGGTEVRMLNIPADAGAGMGLFQNLHGSATPGIFAERLKTNSHKYYGTAIREFLDYILNNLEAVTQTACFYRDEFIREHAAGATGEVVRAASRMGLISAAGMIACSAGILPLRQDEVVTSIVQCFHAWLTYRGISKNDASDLEKSIVKVRSFLEAHGSSRFLKHLKGTDECRAVPNQAGILVVAADGTKTYLIFTETFKSEICPGNHREVAKKLWSEGILERDKDEWTVKRGKHRFYSISEDILDYGSQEVQNRGQEAQKKAA